LPPAGGLGNSQEHVGDFTGWCDIATINPTALNGCHMVSSSLGFPRCGCVRPMLLLVMPEVASLAERRQVASLPVRRVVIEMSHREDDADQLERGRIEQAAEELR
jgi:hypothetical protein